MTLDSTRLLTPTPGPGPVIGTPVIDNIELDVRRDVGNAEVTLEFDINWPEFARATDLDYREVCQLLRDGTAVYTFPWSLRANISPGGNATTHRTKQATVDWDDLDVNPNGDDHISAVITLTPLLPTQVSRQSAELTV